MSLLDWANEAARVTALQAPGSAYAGQGFLPHDFLSSYTTERDGLSQEQRAILDPAFLYAQSLGGVGGVNIGYSRAQPVLDALLSANPGAEVATAGIFRGTGQEPDYRTYSFGSGGAELLGTTQGNGAVPNDVAGRGAGLAIAGLLAAFLLRRRR